MLFGTSIFQLDWLDWMFAVVLTISGVDDWWLDLLCISVFLVVRICVERFLRTHPVAIDKKAEYALRTALTNHIVLDRIFSNLELHDLKQCRLVNKFWESEVGSHIRRFRRCYAYIGGSRRCADVTALGKIISKTTFVPIINGLSVSFYEDHRKGHSKSQWNESSNAISELTEKLSLKYLEISGNVGSDGNVGPQRCPAVELVVKVFREKLTDVVELKFDEFPGSYGTYFEHDWNPVLPNLKVLYLGTTDFDFKKLKNMRDFVAKILRVTPKLQKLKADDNCSRFLPVLPKDKYPLVNSFRLYVASHKIEKYSLELAAAKPKLSRLLVQLPPNSESRYVDSCLGIAKELMISSHDTLEKLQIMSASFPPEFLNFPALVHLRKLKISGENGLSLPQILAVLRSIDYSKMLPSLSTVSIRVTTSSEEIVNPWANDDVAAGIMHFAATVEELEVEADFTRLGFQDLSAIFPKLSFLDVILPLGAQGPLPYTDLFASWPKLEVLYVIEGAAGFRKNFDLQFLGIHPEEVEILRKMDDKSLEKMHIVPIRPCLLTMLCLKSVDFCISAEDAIARKLPRNQVFLSRLTGIIALRKMVRNGVEIHLCGDVGHERLIRHLQPFTSDDRGSSIFQIFTGLY